MSEMSAGAVLPDNATPSEAPGRSERRSRLVPVLLLIIVIGGVYLLTMHQGVGRGDSAALQYNSTVLGLCYPPGYQTEILFGKLFTMLPVGPDPAWRVNLMQVVFGVIACLAIYGTVLGITGNVLPGAVAALTLAFSSIFWSMSTFAEVYVFYGAFLILGLYCCQRFVSGGRRVWVYLTALALGFSIGGRPSELSVLPAFIPVWVFYRKKVRLTPATIAVCLLLFLLPLGVSVAGYMVHYADPAASPVWDDVLGEQIRTGQPGLPEAKPVPARLCDAFYYSLGLMWTGRIIHADVAARDLWDYARMLSGVAAFDRIGEDYLARVLQREHGTGTCIGILGVALVVWGTIAWRRQYGWVLLGWGMFVGNLCFYIYNHQVDSRTFIIPGLAGLSVFVGLGTDALMRLDGSRVRRAMWPLACLATPALLLATNWAKVNCNTSGDRLWVHSTEMFAKAPLPQRCAFVMTPWPGNMCRYVMRVVAGRRDVTIINAQDEWVPKAIDYFLAYGRSVVVPYYYIGAEDAAVFLQDTPAAIAETGMILITPEGLRRRPG